MSKPFKFRYVNEIVGGFVIAIALALVVGIILAGRAQDWFEPIYEIRLEFPEEGSLGLQQGADVQILGASAGRVGKIRVQDDGSMYTTLEIKSEFIRFIRTDSKAIVKKKFGIAGDAFVEITQGRGAPLGEEAVLQAIRDTEITELAREILKEVQNAVLPLLEEYRRLAADLRDAEKPLMQALANIERITRGLAEGEGTAGQLLRDPKTAQEIEAMLADIRSILEDIKETTARLPPMAATVKQEVDALPGTVVQAQETLRESERLIEGIQRHWLIRKYVPPTVVPDMIPPDRAGGP
ncbi:MAG: MlaD family protein [Kiritimatiellae bacterium]|nr:MlaD family protein [Kiritimatiellia bacterium]MDW8459158.1 MlaD family protein [Verrucomicrobiota bacterium]